ncbi:MAG: hypothetical protein WCS83_02015 [Endomicrobiia bacterium]|nr:hypothetical protein [Endomicrobiaceae bacterium]MDD3052921.1 hypothetical protein [Endomicrobiaceae bacterium]MDD3922889.1 hypothetical protein [Endomicrobiaceae bacterium]
MIKKIVLFISCILLLNASSAQSACSLTCDFSEYTAMNASVRSAIMPGWGQGWNEQTTKGWIVFGVFSLSVFGAFYYYNVAESDYEKYENMGSINGSLYNDYKSSLNTSRTLGVVAIATWVYAVVDAYIVANKKSKLYSYKKFDVTAYSNDGIMLKYKTKISI